MVKEWLVELQPKIDLNTFKKAISIATDKGKCNKCRDLIFIFKDDGAASCECRVVIEAKEVIKKLWNK